MLWSRYFNIQQKDFFTNSFERTCNQYGSSLLCFFKSMFLSDKSPVFSNYFWLGLASFMILILKVSKIEVYTWVYMGRILFRRQLFAQMMTS